MTSTPGATRPTRTRRRRWPLVLFALVVVLVLLAGTALVVGDPLLRRTAEQRTAASLQESLHASEPPSVTFGGTPFVTQYLQRRYQRLTIRADDLATGQIKLAHLEAELRDVRTDRAGTAARANSIRGSAVVAWAELTTAAGGTPLRFAEPDRVETTLEFRAGSLPIQVVLTARPSVDVDQQAIVLSDARVSLMGVTVPDSVVGPVAEKAVKPIAVPLPAGLRLTGGGATSAGMAIEFSGMNVDLSALR